MLQKKFTINLLLLISVHKAFNTNQVHRLNHEQEGLDYDTKRVYRTLGHFELCCDKKTFCFNANQNIGKLWKTQIQCKSDSPQFAFIVIWVNKLCSFRTLPTHVIWVCHSHFSSYLDRVQIRHSTSRITAIMEHQQNTSHSLETPSIWEHNCDIFNRFRSNAN